MTRYAIRQRQCRAAERVTLRIDRLDLHGFSPSTARRIADSLTGALARELAGLEVLPELSARQDTAVAAMPDRGAALPEDVGAALAHRIIGRIAP